MGHSSEGRGGKGPEGGSRDWNSRYNRPRQGPHLDRKPETFIQESPAGRATNKNNFYHESFTNEHLTINSYVIQTSNVFIIRNYLNIINKVKLRFVCHKKVNEIY